MTGSRAAPVAERLASALRRTCGGSPDAQLASELSEQVRHDDTHYGLSRNRGVQLAGFPKTEQAPRLLTAAVVCQPSSAGWR
jgi:hypothetical protein